MYPYFAFDVPLLRNEVAHKGMLQTENAEFWAYNLVLDLNTLSQLVKTESYISLCAPLCLFHKYNTIMTDLPSRRIKVGWLVRSTVIKVSTFGVQVTKMC